MKLQINKRIYNFKLSYVVLGIVLLDFVSLVHQWDSGNAGIYFGMLVSSIGWLLAERSGEALVDELAKAKLDLQDMKVYYDAS